MDTNNPPANETTDEPARDRTTESATSATSEHGDAEQSPPEAGANAMAGPAPPAITDRYATLELGEEAVVIFDRENADAWIQTDAPVELPDPAGGDLDG